jgi:sugar-phosphatase
MLGVQRAVPAIRCRAVLFDLDGVLVDSTECVERTWRRWALAHGLDPARVITVAHGRRTTETIEIVAPHLPAAEEGAALALSESTTTDGIYEVAGARELVAGLPPTAWAVVTSGIRAVASLRIRHAKLPWPPVLICADEIERGKPDPEGYLTAAQRLGHLPGDCIVIEDAPAGIAAARAAGMRAVAIASTHAADSLAAADVIVHSLAALSISPSNDDGVLEIGVAVA